MTTLTEITADKYDEMLNMLPPAHWMHPDAFDQKFNRIPETFIFPEEQSEGRYLQFAKLEDHYFRKEITLADRSTWITGAEIDGPEESRLTPGARIERDRLERQRMREQGRERA